MVPDTGVEIGMKIGVDQIPERLGGLLKFYNRGPP